MECYWTIDCVVKLLSICAIHDWLENIQFFGWKDLKYEKGWDLKILKKERKRIGVEQNDHNDVKLLYWHIF